MRRWQRGQAAPEQSGLPTLVLGAGQAGREVVRALRAAPDYGLRPIGFLEDDRRIRRAVGLPVLGRLDDVADVASRVGARAALVSIPSLPVQRIGALIEQASSANLMVRYLPTILAAIERSVRVSDLSGINVEKLLGRDEVQVASERVRSLVRSRRVLVTGAGGSIGSELCRQVRRFEPASLYLVDHDESNLHALHLELAGSGVLDDDDIIVADIRDRSRLDQIFAETRPDLVLHAAAHKHLPLLERHPCEGVKTNVQGTHHLVDMARKYGTARFVLISTDKAADPTSVLGATKRLAEVIVQTAAGGPTAMASVRFGNVLGSRGSLLSVLAGQMTNGHAFTITHPDVTRYFMTIEEAAGLVLEAAVLAEYAETFVLDMGEPVGIVDLVHKYAAAAHMQDIRITFTGLRPGEKLTEKVFSDAETRVPTAHPKVWATRATMVPSELGTGLQRLYAAAADNDDARVVALLHQLLPDYQPTQRVSVTAGMGSPYPDGL
jgi:FlaA1/EpsC-like NDP-sugar epimerase